MENKSNSIWVVLRFVLGFIFLWGFFDKVFGLGFNTLPEESWLSGVSPTFGYLQFATYGPFSGLMKGLAGNVVVDMLFMGGQLLIGLSLILGVGVRVACYSGIALMALIYLSAFPAEFNPIIDEHVVYILVLMGILWSDAGAQVGLGAMWRQTEWVQRYPVLQ